MRQLGIFEVLLSGICFGFLGIFGKWGFEAGLSPGEFLCLRFLFASSLLGLWMLLFRRAQLKMEPKKLLIACALGVLGYAVFSSFFFEALRGLSASLTFLLLYTYPVMVTLGAWFFLGEVPHFWQKVALPIVILGLVLLVWGDFQVYASVSLLFGVLAAVFYSVYILLSSKLLRGVPAHSSTLYIMFSAGVALALLHFRAHTIEVLPQAIWIVLGTALIGTLLAMSLFLSGLQKLKNAEVSVLSTSEPVTGVLLAGIFLGERMRFEQWLGAALILLGMILVGLKKQSAR